MTREEMIEVLGELKKTADGKVEYYRAAVNLAGDPLTRKRLEGDLISAVALDEALAMAIEELANNSPKAARHCGPDACEL